MMRNIGIAVVFAASAALVAGCGGAARTHSQGPVHEASSAQTVEPVAEPKPGVEAPLRDVVNYLSSCLDVSFERGVDEAVLTISAKQNVGECGCKSALVRYALVTAVGGEVFEEGELNTLHMANNTASVKLKLSSKDEQRATLTLGCSNSL